MGELKVSHLRKSYLDMWYKSKDYGGRRKYITDRIGILRRYWETGKFSNVNANVRSGNVKKKITFQLIK